MIFEQTVLYISPGKRLIQVGKELGGSHVNPESLRDTLMGTEYVSDMFGKDKRPFHAFSCWRKDDYGV